MSKGYYDNEELNRKSFVQNPLTTDKLDIVFRTGDFGQYLPDRVVKVLGRVDDQVKVNGIRVELKDLEQQFLNFSTVDEVSVIAHKTIDNQTELICYYVSTSLQAEEMRKLAENVIDKSVVPSYFVPLTEFPRNANGKLDRGALPLPSSLQKQVDNFSLPTNEAEEKLLKIWEGLLGQQRFGINQSFFDCGGNSLKAIQLVSYMEQTFDVELRMVDVFQNPTIRQLAQLIQKSNHVKYLPISSQPLAASYPLSNAQMRVWLQHVTSEFPFMQNLHAYYKVAGALDVKRLEDAFRSVLLRHESLRTVFVVEGGVPRQQVVSPDTFDFTIATHRLDADTDIEIQRLAEKYLRHEFNLEKSPLLTVAVHQANSQAHYLFITIHHIVIDEWSMQILVREVLTLYQSGNHTRLLDLPIQYKDFVVWQQEHLLKTKTADRAYWKEKLQPPLPSVDFPKSYARGSVKTCQGKMVSIVLSRELTNKVDQYVRQTGTSTFTCLLACLQSLVARMTNQYDVIIGSPIATRSHIQLDQQVGIYINTVPFRTHLKPTESFSEILRNVHRTVTEAFEHGEYPFDELVNDLGLAREANRSMLFDIGFTWHIEEPISDEIGTDLQFEPIAMNFMIADTDLWIHAFQRKDDIRVVLVYNKDLYDSSFSDSFLALFKQTLDEVTQNNALRLFELLVGTHAVDTSRELAIHLNI
jgi:acyl carrier protein